MLRYRQKEKDKPQPHEHEHQEHVCDLQQQRLESMERYKAGLALQEENDQGRNPPPDHLQNMSQGGHAALLRQRWLRADGGLTQIFYPFRRAYPALYGIAAANTIFLTGSGGCWELSAASSLALDRNQLQLNVFVPALGKRY